VPGLISLYNLRTARKKLDVTNEELTSLRIRTQDQLEDRKLKSKEVSQNQARGHLEEHRKRLSDVQGDLETWLNKKAGCDATLRVKRTEQKTIRDDISRLSTDLNTAAEMIEQLQTEKRELEEDIDRTRKFINRVGYEIQNDARNFGTPGARAAKGSQRH
jgi:chromosome segregation ATPase